MAAAPRQPLPATAPSTVTHARSDVTLSDLRAWGGAAARSAQEEGSGGGGGAAAPLSHPPRLPPSPVPDPQHRRRIRTCRAEWQLDLRRRKAVEEEVEPSRLPPAHSRPPPRRWQQGRPRLPSQQSPPLPPLALCPIPPSLVKHPNLRYVNLSGNIPAGTIPPGLLHGRAHIPSAAARHSPAAHDTRGERRKKTKKEEDAWKT
uniref:Uncharacterized protein n=1 Tax=Oryza nivara TaxID=4536 RepID=A0A0E0ICW7_ORYNI